jgi:di/tricarboxylate transporter
MPGQDFISMLYWSSYDKDMQIALVLGLLTIAIGLFAAEVTSVDIITMILLIVLVISGILTPSEAFAGFSNEIIIILTSIFVLSGALQKTGIVDTIGSLLYRIAGNRPNRLVLAVTSVVGSVSAFMNNTTATAVFLPPVMGLCRKAKISPSQILMPMAFASMLGGTCTLIGTSTNVAVSGYIAKLGMRPISLFEITPVGLALLLVGILYLTLVSRRLLPAHKGESQAEDYGMRRYMSEIAVLPDSPLLGEKIFDSDLSRLGFRILQVLRGSQKILPDPRTAIQPLDILLVEGKIEDLMNVKDMAGIEIKALLSLQDSDLQSEDNRIAEAILMPQSHLIDRTLKEINFRQRYRLIALAIYRHGHSLCEKLGHIRLRVGDVLLLLGQVDSLRNLRQNPDLSILDELDVPLARQRKGFYAVIVFVLAIAAGGLGLVPLSIAFLTAAALTMLMRCITVEEAYQFIDWRLIILIAGMTAFGTAMEKTGTAAFLAGHIIRFLQPFGVMTVLAGFCLLTIVLTQPMSNAAAALVVLPVALNTAHRLGANERTFAIAIMLAASISMITPFEPSCILVYGPGKYRFLDFVKTGWLLTVILAGIVLLLLPVFWPLYPSAPR